jgi:dTDP-4-dehydrorhamnose 3,5-epimerase
MELFRREWGVGIEPIQWNVLASRAGVLRGVHVHPRHDDYLTLFSGRATIGLCDLRRGSPTERRAAVVEMSGEAPSAITIPHGVAHGFYFPEPSVHIYAVSHYWDLADELACRWDDPGLRIPWSPREPILSPRDATAPSLATLLDQLAPFQPLWEEPA